MKKENGELAFYSINEKPIAFIILTALLGGALVSALAVASKLVELGSLVFSATVIAYAATFLLTDVVGEIYGKKVANLAVFGGFLAVLLGTAVFYLAIILPGAPFWMNAEGFNETFGSTWRITLGGVLAYLVSQYHDVWSFHFWRKVTKGKHLWLRNNLSTGISQIIDTIIFITIAFGFSLPLIIGQYLAKLIIALLDTPLIYAVVWFIRRN